MFDKEGRGGSATPTKIQVYPKGMNVVDGGRVEVDGVVFEDDFCSVAIDKTNRWNCSSTGTSGAVEISAAINGVCLLDSGTDPDLVSVIASPLNFASARQAIFEARLRPITSLAGIFLVFGFTDNVLEDVAKLAFKDGSLVEASVDSWADDAAMFGVRQETSANIYALSVIANAAPQSDDTGIDLVIDTWHTYRVELDATGNAKFYIDGVKVAEQALAITPADPLCAFVGQMITTGSTAAFVEVDYIKVWQARVI